uniref:NADH-ubiquinone oxidoreductase chain 1 n=1 Tax=Lasioderma serricorne TaxID=295660 RepID=A0A4P8D2K1_9COLE|nr:NADH dehydrogenase subunit 1 [Lasioderma serricorne]QYH50926.1 NADH dehydrogenase subunit 1 [Lasioderma serricorne]
MIFDNVLVMISFLILLISVLVGVAFLTLLERKILGYIQIRKGPNKVGFMGILQPFSDAIKLFSKEQTNPFMSNFNLYYFSPIMNLFLGLFIWLSFPFMGKFIMFNFNVLFFLACSSVMVYSIMISGWASNSNYSMLGGMRAVAQSISYEVSLVLILISFLIMISSFNLFQFMIYQSYMWFIFMFLPLSIMWIVSCLAETNRTPFDFAEGESELVSGFNIEYSSGGFALIFMAEYSSIIFMSFLCSMMFIGGDLLSFMFFLKISLMSFFWIWVRGTLPRYRYDKLMYMAWKIYLPVSLNMLIFYISIKLFFFF